jgi:hypothetical protein
LTEKLSIVCPGCGSNNHLQNPGIVSLVCTKCTIVITRKGAQLKAGKVSLLAPASSSLRVGGHGRVRGRRVEVLGRLRIEHRRGVWDEWFCEDASGEPMWLVEEEGRFRLDKPIDTALPEGIAKASVGEVFQVLGQRFQVAETGKATVIGGEGQLPHGFEPGEQIRYVDLSAIDAKERLSIEVSTDGVVAFIGRPISAALVDFPKTWRADSPREEGQTIQCEGCGSALDIRPLPRPVKTLTCHYCGSVHALYGDQSSLLGKNPPRDDFHLMVGARGRLKGVAYEVIGRMVYESFEFDDGVWSTWPSESHEYVLVDDAGNFVTIEVGDEGVAVSRKTGRVPQLAAIKRMAWGQRFRQPGGRTYRQYERGRSTLVYVDGALPWVAKVNDQLDFVDLIDVPNIWSGLPPERLSVEWTADKAGEAEVEAFIAHDLSPSLLARSFDECIEPTPKKQVLRPPRRSPALARFGGSWAVMGLVFLVVAGLASLGDGVLLGQAVVYAGASPVSGQTEVFSLEDDALVSVDLSTNANNNWLYAEVDLVHADSGISLGFVGREVSYYHGTEGGERWSEGRKTWRQVFVVSQGGQYRLKVSLSEAGQQGVKAVASVSKLDFDPKVPYQASFFMMIAGIFISVWSVAGRQNLWPSND